LYLRKQIRLTRSTDVKIAQAKEDGLFEPVTLHPEVDLDTCIGSGACITACPEEDVLGLRNGKATLVNASRCVGHGACFHACPVEAITLRIGTEKRGVDLPHVRHTFETNVPGVYIAGELGGMGLIKNSVEQGRQAMENIARSLNNKHGADYDVIIVGAGPAGISGALTAQKNKLNFLILEQDSLGGTVFTFPRSKIVMTSPMDLPLYGKVKLHETSKDELLELWNTVLRNNDISIREGQKVDEIETLAEGETFRLKTSRGEEFHTARVLLAIGRRGTPRKLGVPGEDTGKVAYRLLEPEEIGDKKIMVVGGGDSAVESAMLLMDNNDVTLSYRRDSFSRIKPKNSKKIKSAIESGKLRCEFESNVKAIHPDYIDLEIKGGEVRQVRNDLIYIFAGGELPTSFLEKTGIKITKRFNYALLKHDRK
jgi:thioredoxin reductase/Pyruvate/2-oxoacid:ferredoxin oxidoreductase delta subunit